MLYDAININAQPTISLQDITVPDLAINSASYSSGLITANGYGMTAGGFVVLGYSGGADISTSYAETYISDNQFTFGYTLGSGNYRIRYVGSLGQSNDCVFTA
jgi:hypothetical protein